MRLLEPSIGPTETTRHAVSTVYPEKLRLGRIQTWMHQALHDVVSVQLLVSSGVRYTHLRSAIEARRKVIKLLWMRDITMYRIV